MPTYILVCWRPTHKLHDASPHLWLQVTGVLFLCHNSLTVVQRAFPDGYSDRLLMPAGKLCLGSPGSFGWLCGAVEELQRCHFQLHHPAGSGLCCLRCEKQTFVSCLWKGTCDALWHFFFSPSSKVRFSLAHLKACRAELS